MAVSVLFPAFSVKSVKTMQNGIPKRRSLLNHSCFPIIAVLFCSVDIGTISIVLRDLRMTKSWLYFQFGGKMPAHQSHLSLNAGVCLIVHQPGKQKDIPM